MMRRDNDHCLYADRHRRPVQIYAGMLGARLDSIRGAQAARETIAREQRVTGLELKAGKRSPLN